jgi:hypothetical protein
VTRNLVTALLLITLPLSAASTGCATRNTGRLSMLGGGTLLTAGLIKGHESQPQSLDSVGASMLVGLGAILVLVGAVREFTDDNDPAITGVDPAPPVPTTSRNTMSTPSTWTVLSTSAR